MKPKRIAVLFLTVLLCLGVSVSASAREWTGGDFTFTVPEEFVYEFGPNLSAEDPAWALGGMGDATELLSEYAEMGVLADFYTEDKSMNFKVMTKESSASKNIFTLGDMTEEELQSFLDELVQAKIDEIKVEKGMIDVNGQPFFYFQIDGEGEQYGGSHELQYGTVINGYTLAFDVIGGEEGITAEEKAMLETVARSVRFTQVLERPEPDTNRIILVIALLAVLILMVASPLIYIPLRNRKQKREKAKMAERLEEFHKQYGENSTPGEPKFVNSTDCTKEAVREFSRYHAYWKNIPTLVGQSLLCLVVIAAVFLFDSVWWVKLLAVGVTLYFAYRVFNMGTTVERVQQKVFGRGLSSTAHYTFYEDSFRVGGIQSAMLYPYFQITDVRIRGHYVYLYYGIDNAYIVDQYGFSVGEYEAFLTFIREKARKEK